MRIGIVLSKTPGYSETFLNSKIKGLKASGFDVVLFVQEADDQFLLCEVKTIPSLSKYNLMKQFSKWITVFSNLIWSEPKQVFRFLKLELNSHRSVIQILKNIYNNAHLLKSDLDWVHFGFSTIAIGSEHVAKSIGAKMAVSCRGYDMDVYPLNHPNCYDLVWKQVDKVHAISAYMLKKAYENGLSKSTSTNIIYPALDIDLFQDINYSEIQINIPIKITTIARLHWIKGLNYVLEALYIFKSIGIDFKYQIIGYGPEYEALRFTIHQLDLEDNVSLVGELSHQDALKRLEDTDIYIQYSHSEGFCNAVLEAQAKGCLCIVSNGGALPENIIDEETGYVVRKCDALKLANKIEQVISLPVEYKNTIIKNARDRVSKYFMIGNQQKQFVEFYKSSVI